MDSLFGFAESMLIERAGVDSVANAPDFADFADVSFKIVDLPTSRGLVYQTLVAWFDESPPNGVRAIAFMPDWIDPEQLLQLRNGAVVTVKAEWRGEGWELIA